MNKLQLAEIEEIKTIDNENFKIEDKEQAQWALRKIRALKAHHDEIVGLADAEIYRVTTWQDKECEGINNSIAFFEGLLKDYMTKERAQDPDLKSVKLPAGTIRFRKQQPEYIRDEDALIEWAKKLDKHELIKVTESLNWAALKKNIAVVGGKALDKETGELIEHVTINPREDKFIVEVN